MKRTSNYHSILNQSGIRDTSHRRAVLEAIATHPGPLSAMEILVRLRKKTSINKATLYRVINLLVGHGIINRLSAGDRSFRYGMSDSFSDGLGCLAHPHFVCTQCGAIECLRPGVISMDLKDFKKGKKVVVKKVEIRVEGVCERCLDEEAGLS